MGALDDAMREVARAVIGTLVTSPATFTREEPPDYATGTPSASLSWSVMAGPPESTTESILARGGLPDGTTAGEVRVTVPALNVPSDMGEPRVGDRLTLPGETGERLVVEVSRVGVEQPAAWVVRVRP